MLRVRVATKGPCAEGIVLCLDYGGGGYLDLHAAQPHKGKHTRVQAQLPRSQGALGVGSGLASCF